ncbi:MAG: AAA family ATPase, partial [Rikenellaceae bacterium]|nr:AAA family ATPase [Rikenellaceae bacterium]
MGQTVLIAFSNQKGGVGKSTIAVTLAGYLHYTMGKNVAIIDCDSGQHSLNRLRDSEKQTLEKVDDYKIMMMEQWERIHKKAYPILESNPQRVRRDIDALLASDVEYDIIFIDLPGSISTEGVLSTIVNVDYVLVPIVPDRFDMRSTLGFATAVMDFKTARKDLPLKE